MLSTEGGWGREVGREIRTRGWEKGSYRERAGGRE